MKKEVSDHIAKAFFENKNNKKNYRSFSLGLVLTLGVIITFILVVTFLLKSDKKNILVLGQKILLEKHDGPYVLNFNFSDSSSKVESLIIDIPDIDVSAYTKLKFSVRIKDTDTRKLGVLKVALTNRRKESSNLYISEIDNAWKEINVSLSDFNRIHDWSNLAKLSFTIEEWNLFPKKGELLIEGIEFSKK